MKENKWRLFFWITLLMAIVLSIIGLCSHLSYDIQNEKNSNQIDSIYSCKITDTDTSTYLHIVYYNKENISDKNKYVLKSMNGRIKYLSEMTIQQIAIGVDVTTNLENMKTQSRGFYIVIFGALLTVIFLKPSDNIKPLRNICLIGMGFTIGMYFYDVSSQDLLDRNISSNQRHTRTLYRLVNLDTVNLASLDLDYSEIPKTAKYCTRFPEIWCRKMKSALMPNLEQIIFYFLPLLIFSISGIKEERRGKKDKNILETSQKFKTIVANIKHKKK